MNPRNIDALGIAVGNALNALAAAHESQDLVAAYSLIGSQLADAGRQQADNSQIREVARRCADEADISGPLQTEDYLPFSRQVRWEGVVNSVTLKSIVQLHEDGLKADEQDVREAADAEIDRIKRANTIGKLRDRAPRIIIEE